MGKVVKREEIKKISEKLKSRGKKIVFTNGCFDILHRGHVEYLNEAKKFGDVLIVGINSDSSVKKLKGEKRPINSEEDRAYILSNLISVDFVVIFKEETPLKLISEIIPNYLIKGGDWSVENIVGREIVEKNGGRCLTIKFKEGYSTTKIIEKIKNEI